MMMRLQEKRRDEKPRNTERSGDQLVLWVTLPSCLGALLGAQEHRRETLICDVFFLQSWMMPNMKEHRRDVVIRGLFLILFGAVLEPFWVLKNTVGRR